VRQGYSRERLARLLTNAGLDVEVVRYTFGRCGTLMFDLFFATGDSRPNPVLYGLLFPLYMLLAGLDRLLPAPHGAAVLGVARKPAAVWTVRDVQAVSVLAGRVEPTPGNLLQARRSTAAPSA
jgi:hypothetical protein